MSTHPEDQTARMLEMLDNLESDKYQLKEYKFIGEKIPRRIDGLAKASGQADYHGHPASRHAVYAHAYVPVPACQDPQDGHQQG